MERGKGALCLSNAHVFLHIYAAVNGSRAREDAIVFSSPWLTQLTLFSLLRFSAVPPSPQIEINGACQIAPVTSHLEALASISVS